MPVELAHELAAFLVAEVVGDVLRRQTEDVPGVPREVMAGADVEGPVAEPGRGTNAFQWRLRVDGVS